MSGSIIQVAIFLIFGIGLGGAIGWLIRGLRGKQQLETLHDEWQIKFADATRQRDKFLSEGNKLRRAVESQKALLKKHERAATSSRTEIESLREKQKSVSKDLFSLGEERDAAKKQVVRQQQALISAKHQIGDLQTEFSNACKLYKGELAKALELRTTLEGKLGDAKAEQDSLANLLNAAKAESQSVNKMLAAAQTRLDNLDDLESKAIALEAENAELRHEVSRLQQQVDVLQRDIAELEELKVQNRELAHCLKSMENSRKQYETDAKRYRDQADQSEKQSETLRIKLDDVEKNLAAIAKQHEESRKHVRETGAVAETNGKTPPAPVIDDLTEIVGIGKVFQNTLHKLGVYSFQQIASFGPADIARINMALKENRGRMEQDDWIGQAKELYYKKYSETVEH